MNSTTAAASNNTKTIAWIRALSDKALAECIAQQESCLLDSTPSAFTAEDQAMLALLNEEESNRQDDHEHYDLDGH